MNYSQEVLARMTDVEFKAVYLNHKLCGMPWCFIARETFNRPRRSAAKGDMNPHRQPVLEPKFH